jgi:hypothetical protein
VTADHTRAESEQRHADEQAARALAHRLRHIPPSLLADPDALARQFIAVMRENGWYHRDTPPAVTLAQPDPEATARGVAKAREALRKERPMTCPPCAAAADEDQALACPVDMPGHDASICRDPDTCPCAHQPVGTSTPTEENHG